MRIRLACFTMEGLVREVNAKRLGAIKIMHRNSRLHMNHSNGLPGWAHK